jgi:hydroxymethylbilane synthase
MSQIFNKIRIGSRSSKLALAQVQEVKNLLSPHLENSEIEVVLITTSGDKIQDRNLAEIGGKGLFIKELEEALIQNKIDIAIHSAKDVPPFLHEETKLAAFTERFDARDCLISKNFNSISELPKGAVVGTSSARRKAILLSLRPDLKIVNFRGNVDTRLKKVENGEVDATILAVCGLERLGKKTIPQLTCPFGYDGDKAIEKNLMLPAGGQGALAIQIRKNAPEIYELVRKINNSNSEICLKSERAFLSELGASCSTPVAVHGEIIGEKFVLKTQIFDFDGSQNFSIESSCEANLEKAQELGLKAAQKTKDEAENLLKKICK